MISQRFLTSFSRALTLSTKTPTLQSAFNFSSTVSYRYKVFFPEEYTTKKLRLDKLAGRDPVTGRVVVGTRGGGHKKKFRWVDIYRHGPKEGPPLVERVIHIQYDPCRSARIALVAAGDKMRYLIATQGMKAGDLISTYGEIPRIPVRPKEGDGHPLGALPLGTEVCCVELFPGKGCTLATAAGTYANIIRKVDNHVIIQLPSKREISVNQECMATVGRVSNPEHSSIPIGSPNRLRWLGFRPRSGLWHRKDGRFGRKIKPLPPVTKFDKPFVNTIEEISLTLTK
nr:EOG090X0COM [Eulimnadia texana]